ncbi:MarR family winged helix-turn-helix transcriptional regulator [Telluribacter sp. SYSU D00476]|uniref:MarR family winged helix-turn-helix transcriptional regulator n=1 Tax=Telluribacter sp. SYSU D00476 TaxID=2811430 RepID=UPI001FF279BC|nr:MarR family winged helix-turn-helix transcriptional regulator [Telluribacter sp. SYSU D00476]
MQNYKNTGVYLRQLLDSLIDNLHNELEVAGYGEIRPTHGTVFQYIKEEGSRITELAAEAKITKQSMSAIVYELEEKGYLERKPDESDKRAVLFVLTTKGRELRALGRSINHAFEKRWEARLGEKQYQEFRKYLEELCS